MSTEILTDHSIPEKQATVQNNEHDLKLKLKENGLRPNGRPYRNILTSISIYSEAIKTVRASVLSPDSRTTIKSQD